MMWKRATAAVLFLSLSGLAASAQTLYVTEPFSVPAGNLSGQGSGTGWGGSWAASLGSITANPGTGQNYSSLLTSGNSVTSSNGTPFTQYTRAISAASTPSNDFWVSFLVNTNATAINQYAGVGIGGVFLGKSTGTATYGIGTVGASGGTTSITAPTGRPDLLVAHFKAAGGVDLYVNPTSLAGAAPGATSASTVTGTTTLAGSLGSLLSGAISGGIPTTTFSDIRIGDSFATVTPVPEPATVLALAAGGLGLVRLRRRLV